MAQRKEKHEYVPVVEGRHELPAGPEDFSELGPPPAYSERPEPVPPQTTSRSVVPEPFIAPSSSRAPEQEARSSQRLSRRMSNLSISSTSSSSSCSSSSSSSSCSSSNSSSSSGSDRSRGHRGHRGRWGGRGHWGNRGHWEGRGHWGGRGDWRGRGGWGHRGYEEHGEHRRRRSRDRGDHKYQHDQYDEHPSTNESRQSREIWSGKNAFRTTDDSQLPKTVAIPATSHKTGSPFVRAYPPYLQAFGMDREFFLKFIDDLNHVAVENSPLQASSTTGTVDLSKGNTEKFLQDANQTIFRPRGLELEVAKLKRLAHIANIPILDRRGDVQENVYLVAPTNSEDLERYRRGEDGLNSQERRLRALSQYITPLDMSYTPDTENRSDPPSRWGFSAGERERSKEERKMEKERRKQDRKDSKIGREARKHERKVHKKEHKLDKYIAKNQHRPERIQRKMQEFEQRKDAMDDRFDAKVERKTRRRHRKRSSSKEEKSIREILWLVVREVREPTYRTHPPPPAPGGTFNQYPAPA